MKATFEVYQLDPTEIIRATDFFTIKVDGKNAILCSVHDSIGSYVEEYPQRNFWRIIGYSGSLTEE